MDNRTPDSSSGSQHPHLPPGFRFHPTDEELVVHYLKRKASSAPLPVAIIAEVDLYKFDPWELPSKAAFGEEEWYFFSPRDRKYPNGARPNRAATSGYWKATGTDKPILASDGNQKVGVKKALVFYGGKPPKGVKTNWIMHEYRLADNKSFNSSSTSNKPPRLAADPPHTSNKKNSLRLDDWVLCRIYKKSNSNTLPRPPLMEQDKEFSRSTSTFEAAGLENDDNFFDGILASDQSMQNNGCDSHNSKGNNFTVKQALTSEFWNNETGSPAGSPSSSKRFHGDLNCGNSNAEENNSFVSLLSQIPQNAATFHPNAILGSIGDDVLRQQFQIQGINWNS